MARFVPLLAGLLAGLLAALLPANGCDFRRAVGQDLTLPFIYAELQLSHAMRWTHNNNIVFYRQGGHVSTGNATDVSLTGSLTLRNLQLSSSGEYRVSVLDSNGLQAAVAWSCHVCVMDKVPKPELSYICDFPTSSVHLSCQVAKTQGVKFSWAVDGKPVTGKTQRLSISLAKVEAGTSFSCSVANAVSAEGSCVLRSVCQRSPLTPLGLYCFSLNTVQAVFAGGAGAVLLLLAVIVTLCCRRNHRRPQGAGDRGGVRMERVPHGQEPGSNEDYEIMLSSSNPQLQNGERSSLVPQPEGPTANSLSPHPKDGEGQRPSPVPKPRTKSPQKAAV